MDGNFRSGEGFTLIEVLIVVAIFAIIFGFSINSGSNFYYNQVLISERDDFVSLLRNTRNRSLDNVNQLGHGIFISTSTNQYIAFDGASYATRNQDYDVSFPESGAVSITGPSEIVFTALDGTSNVSGTITISASGGVANISINSEGRISW